MKTNLSRNILTEKMLQAKQGKLNLLHMNTEMSCYDGLHSASKVKESQKK